MIHLGENRIEQFWYEKETIKLFEYDDYYVVLTLQKKKQ